jgi:hypothetical protein
MARILGLTDGFKALPRLAEKPPYSYTHVFAKNMREVDIHVCGRVEER